MDAAQNGRGWRIWVLTVLGGVVALAAVALLAILVLQAHLRGPAIRHVAEHSQRAIQVSGPFEAHLLSWHPRIVAEGVTIGNPPWTAAGVTAEIGRLELTFDLPLPGQPFGLRSLRMDRAILHLTRDREGSSNWQVNAPHTKPGTGPPLIRSLRMPAARVYLDDQRRRLQFDGTVSIADVAVTGSAPTLRIDGAGQLNGRAANFVLNGEPLETVTREQPYHFDFTELTQGTRLTGKGSVLHPFDFRYLTATFDAAGEDMKDLYFLVGVSLPDTGGYHLTGSVTREGRAVSFTDLNASSGRSDMRGSVLVQPKERGMPAHVEVALQSQLLRLSDLGARAAGRAAPPADDGKQTLLPDTAFHLEGARKSDATLHFQAEALEAGHITAHSVAATVRFDAGTIKAVPVSAVLHEGKVTAEIEIDVSHDVPVASLDLRAAHLKLGAPQAATSPSPIEGLLQTRIALKGRGNSIHQLASNASGTVTVVMPHGAIRASLAEMAGFDLRALGQLASGSKADAGIRCGVASFDVSAGTLNAQRLLIDTEPMLITGEGTIDLGSEALDLTFQGHPKHPRLRLRAPLLVRGTLGHPSLSMQPTKSVAQVGGAIALGVLLTPVASMLAFVDPGLTKDTDCGALLAQVQTGGK
jgi:uncharacterized protein involved in outer membrane biogenesis